MYKKIEEYLGKSSVKFIVAFAKLIQGIIFHNIHREGHDGFIDENLLQSRWMVYVTINHNEPSFWL